MQACREKGISLTAIPGPCAVTQALCASGHPSSPFQFLGFLPKQRSERKKCIEGIVKYPGTSIAYESPHRLLSSLEDFAELTPNSTLTVARELTKIHEEFVTGRAEELIKHWSEKSVRGEIVLLISPNDEDIVHWWKDLDPKSHVEQLCEKEGLSLKEAIRQVATERGLPRREVYKLVHLDGDGPTQS